MNRTKELNRIKNRLVEIVDRHEKLKNSYFWSPNSHASGRRSAEKRNNDKFECDFLNILAENNYSESCKNVYYHGYFYVDGKKTTVTKIKNIIEALDVIC